MRLLCFCVVAVIIGSAGNQLEVALALLLESPDANPFLPRFYQDPRRWGLATQLFFLFQRVNSSPA